MSFFQNFYHSLYDLTWLRGAGRGSAGRAWQYAWLFLFVISVLQLAPFAYRFPGLMRQAESFVSGEIPNFTAYARAGRLEVKDLAQPYVKTFDDGDGTTKLIVATTGTTTPDIGEFIDKESESGLLLSSTELVLYEVGQKQTRVQSFADLPASDEPFTKADLLNLFSQFRERWIYVFGVLAFFFFFLVMTAGKLIYLFIISLLVFIVTTIAKRQWRLGEIYAVGLFALTLPTLLQTIGRWSGFNWPYVYTIVLLVVMLGAVFYKGDASGAASGQSAAPPAA